MAWLSKNRGDNESKGGPLMSERKPLSAAEKNYLWMVSGGLCSFEGCRKRLVSSSDGALTNVGIIAHIIGHAKRSARHEYAKQYGFKKNELEDVRNLTLMCYEHSKKIDDVHTRDQYPPDLLFKMKNDHEKWVASWSEKQRKKSIALIYKKLGPPITELEFEGEPPHILLEAVEDQNKFTDMSAEGWIKAKSENDELFGIFKEKIKDRQVNVAEVFPLSPIPLLIHMGFLLTDTISLTVYQYDREKQIWVCDYPDGEQQKEHVIEENIVLSDSNELVVSVSISGHVHQKDIDDVIEKKYDLVEVGILNPGVKQVLYNKDVAKIQSRLKEIVETLIQQNNYEKIHLFYAGPAGLAIEIGRGINPRMWSEVCLYQYNFRTQPKYHYAFSI